MTAITIKAFGGEVPRIADHLLTEVQAQLARNVKVQSGGLQSWMRPKTVFEPVRASVASFYRIAHTSGDVWLTWTADVDAVPGAVSNDTDYKVYYTGDTTPRKTNYALATNSGATTECPFDYLELGVPAPINTQSISVVGGAGSNTTRTYVYTYLTTWGEESKPSPSVTVTGKIDGSWNISNMSTGPVGKYSVTKQRIYRSLVDSYGNTNYQLVIEQNSAATYNDTIADSVLGAILGTTAYDEPPTDLRGLIALPNGGMAGFSPSTKQLCFCEPYKPHAWPSNYRYAVEYTPVAVAGAGNSVLVATAGTPYIFSGQHPSVMSSAKLNSVEPCSSKRSCIDMGFGIVFATVNGWMLTSPAGTVMMSRDWFGRDEWNALNPSSIKMAKYDEKLFIFYTKTDTVTKGGYILDKTQNQLASISIAADFVRVDPQNAKLYILQDNKIKQWDADPINALDYDWQSRRYILRRPVNLGIAQVDADYATLDASAANAAALVALQLANQTAFSGHADLLGSWNSNMYNESQADLTVDGFTWNGGLQGDIELDSATAYLTFNLYSGTTLKYTKSVTSRNPFRLPSGYKTDDITVELLGNIDVNYVKLAETAKELQTT